MKSEKNRDITDLIRERMLGWDVSDFGSGDFKTMGAVLDYMLGIKCKADGLYIEPCINSQWESYEVTRPFRENIYKIKVYNPNRKETGVDYIIVDGVRIDSNKVEYKPDGKEHIVEVYM